VPHLVTFIFSWFTTFPDQTTLPSILTTLTVLPVVVVIVSTSSAGFGEMCIGIVLVDAATEVIVCPSTAPIERGDANGLPLKSRTGSVALNPFPTAGEFDGKLI
jgi:hypothetical protein